MILAALTLAAMSGGSVAMPAPSSVPASCPVTTVERWSGSTPSQYPFVRAQPIFSGISMQMQTGTIGAPGSAYAPMRTSGVTVVWHAPTSQVAIKASNGGASFSTSMPVLQNGNVLTFPSAGCWKLHVSSGIKSGDLVLWVV